MVEWTKQAIDALASRIYGERQTYEPERLRAGLNIALITQGIDLVDIYNAGREEGIKDASNPVKPLPTKWFTDDYVDAAVSKARAEALEEAAKVARDCAIYDANDRLLNSDIRATCAAAIRALKDKPANQTDGGE
jgi:hypothetical protein